MKKKLRVGHIGTKHDHSRDIISCLAKFPDDFEIVGVVEEDEKWRALVQPTEPYCHYPFLSEEQLLNAGCDFVVCEGFEYDLPFAALRCVENGIPVHIDKPAGRDIDVFEKVLRTAKAKNLPVQLGYMYRYNPAVADCFELVKSGALGEIHSVTALMSSDHAPEKRQWLDRFGEGGIMFFLGCHMVDMVCMMCGEPEEVIPFNTASLNDGIDSKDLGFAVFKYPHGVSFVKSSASEVNGFERRQVVVNGTKGSFHIQPIEDRTGGPQVEECSHVHISFVEDGVEEPWGPAGKDVVFGPFGRYTEMMTDFAAVVRGEKKISFDYDYELMVQRTLLKACGCSIDLGEIHGTLCLEKPCQGRYAGRIHKAPQRAFLAGNDGNVQRRRSP